VACSPYRHSAVRIEPEPLIAPSRRARLGSAELELLERERERNVLTAALTESHGAGRVALVIGEAGIGKTALVTSVTATLDRRRVLWGACDPLITPRPLGPLRDVAREAGGKLQAVIDRGREPVLNAALDELADEAVLVIEDLHWADDATLDLVALLGRRLVRSPGCLILTSRSEALPEVRRVLTALPRECVRRIEPTPLSAGAVEHLAREAGRDAADLHAVTGGNPFFVTEALATPAGHLPASVRDAVAFRVSMLDDDAREVVELCAVVPGATELELIGGGAGAIDACIEAGLLRLRGETLAFRHDLARLAVEDGISPARRRELDRMVLRALERSGGADLARLVHHARRAGDAGAIRRLAPAAAQAASAAGGHRQALEHWEAVLQASGGTDAVALDGVSNEAYLCGRLDQAVEAARALLAHHEAAGDVLATGDALRRLSRCLWWAGRGEEATEVGDQAIDVLKAFPDSRELAMALSARSQLAMLAEDAQVAIELGTRAVALGRRLGDDEIVAHALTNLGTATFFGGPDSHRGRALIEEAFVLAAGIGHDDHSARALVNLATGTLMRLRDDRRVDEDIERAMRFVRERGLDGYLQYMLGVRATLRVRRGDWTGAEADAHASIAMGEQFGVSQCPALLVLGRLRARRGDPSAGAMLAEAWDRAVATQELQRLAPAAAARAEHAWLEGDLEATVATARPAYELAARLGDAWARSELAFWLWRGGAPVEPLPDDAEPYALAIAGDWRAAATAWGEIGYPYERAEALADADDESARLDALATFDAFGAERSALHLRRRLRADGVRRIPRGPRAASKAGPAGLTPRETEVLDLIVRGATNSEIAQALVIAPKTVDHHVSAVLGKLGVSSRRDAGAALDRLG
jgi:DNA-binding CsgD family transcriptional regulator/tetratricopeptide (TPR) repeat protein